MDSRNSSFPNIPLDKAETKVDFDKSQAICVLQHEYAVTDAKNAKPILGTFGAGPCVIVAIYDETNKIALLTHADANTDIKSLQNAINKMPGKKVAHLYGGNENSKALAFNIYNFLEKNQIAIIGSDVLRGNNEIPASLAIDAKTGKIYVPVGAEHFNINENIKSKLNALPEKNKERMDKAKIRQKEWLNQNKHLWDNRELVSKKFEELLLCPLDEIYNSQNRTVSSFIGSMWESIFPSSSNTSIKPGLKK